MFQAQGFEKSCLLLCVPAGLVGIETTKISWLLRIKQSRPVVFGKVDMR
jgi:hypothetical protein